MIKSIFAEMFNQEEKILMETKFYFYIQQPKYGEFIFRNYRNKEANKFCVMK